LLKKTLKKGGEEMRGRKYALWLVIISAALVTGGLILSCGDDDGDTAVDCQDVCEKLDECDYFIDGELGETLAACVDACEEELAGAGEELIAAFQCITETDCWEIMGSCFCPTVCEKLDECDLMQGNNMVECVYYCEDGFVLEAILCHFAFSSCLYIDMFCPDLPD
jgi:hypothetical protein